MRLEDKLLRQELITGVSIILCIVIIEGIYAAKLNAVYYSMNSPFYDSVSYYNQLALVMKAAHSGNLLKAFYEAIFIATTSLPFLEAIALGLVLEPSRIVSVWLQTLWLAVLGVSIFFYLRKFYINNLWISLALTLPFLGIAALWNFNGGLSDFRVDLHLYLLMGISLTWYLYTYHTERLYPWISCGVFIGLTCLARTIAPVYFLVALGPILVLRLINPENFKRLVVARNMGIMLLLATAVCGWLYVVNFDKMYYYYILWNSDANAKLSVLQSAQHFNLALRSIGWFPIIFAAFLLPFTLRSYFKDYEKLHFLKNLDWKILWFGLAPILFLVLRGAGLNPFVSMPAAFGLILFALKPFRSPLRATSSQRYSLSFNIIATSASIFLLVLTAIGGIDSHMEPYWDLKGGMVGCSRIIDVIVQESEARQLKEATFSTAYVDDLNDDVLWNVFAYGDTFSGKSNSASSLQLVATKLFRTATPIEWNAIPGSSDASKIQHLVDTANQSVDYLILPDLATATLLKSSRSFIVINAFVPQIRELFLQTGNWTEISPAIKISNDESVSVYRNKKLS